MGNKDTKFKNSAVLNKVKGFIDSNSMFNGADTVIASVSGGRDSVTLVTLLNELKEAYGFKLQNIHFNFALRGEESQRDEVFVKNLARKLKLKLICEKADKKNSIRKDENTQTWARRIRFDYYDKLFKENKNTKIALAHNLDDQVETFFMRVIRGGGMKGIGGMKPVARGYLLRPLLCLSRKEIDGYLKKMNMNYVNDSSNETTIYFRNWIRKELVQILGKQKIYEDVKNRIGSLMSISRLEDSFIDNLAVRKLKAISIKDKHRIEIDLINYNKITKALRYRILRKAINQITGTLRGFGLSHIIRADLLRNYEHGTKEIMLPRGVRFIKMYEKLIITDVQSKEVGDFKYDLRRRPPCTISIDELDKRLRVKVLNCIPTDSSGAIYLDLDKFSRGIAVRNFRNGDRILLKGDEGERKIKNIFIGKKIPRNLRKNIVFITDGDRVAAIYGIAIDKRYRVRKESQRILEVALLPEL